MNDLLQNKVAIVTGANREIGAAMAEALAQAGAAVLLAHWCEAERAQAVVDRIRAAGGQADAHEADLSSVQANEQLVARAVASFGRLDIFVANAGLTLWSPFVDTTEATWDTLVNLNLKGSFFGAQAAARQMIAQGPPTDGYGGRIVFSSSVTGMRAVPNAAVYSITKAGLRHMATVLAAELGRHAITVNALGIGATVNARNVADDPQYAERWSTVIPAGRAGQPADVAAALLFLVSPAAAMVTGHTLMLDGGWTTTSPQPT
jgi:3-oxoacyl-[acyl-carrier protein] reductase